MVSLSGRRNARYRTPRLAALLSLAGSRIGHKVLVSKRLAADSSRNKSKSEVMAGSLVLSKE